MKGRPGLVAALNIGEETTMCAIVSLSEESDKFSIIGLSSTPTRGIETGAVSNVNDLAKSIAVVFDAAAQLALAEKEDFPIFVSIGSSHIIGRDCFGGESFGGEYRVTDFKANLTAVRRSGICPFNEKCVQLHLFPYSFSTDLRQLTSKPQIGVRAQRIDVNSFVIACKEGIFHAYCEALKIAGLLPRVRHIIPAPIAAGYTIFQLEPNGKNRNFLLIDIGELTSDLVYYQRGIPRFFQSLPHYSGEFITQAILTFLNCSEADVAEDIPVLKNEADLSSLNAKGSLSLRNGLVISLRDLNALLREAYGFLLEELFGFLIGDNRVPVFNQYEPLNIVFTGGGSRINGLTIFAKSELKRIFYKKGIVLDDTNILGSVKIGSLERSSHIRQMILQSYVELSLGPQYCSVLGNIFYALCNYYPLDDECVDDFIFQSSSTNGSKQSVMNSFFSSMWNFFHPNVSE